MSRYLFVCGGAGKHLVTDLASLDFDGVMQIDVQSEIITDVYNRSVRVMGLPLIADTTMTATYMFTAAINELEETLHSINERMTNLQEHVTVQTLIASLAVIRHTQCTE